MSVIRTIVIVLGVLATTLGCGSANVVAGAGEQANDWQHMSAGFVGCRAADITITEHASTMMGFASWIATCRGREFVCSFAGATAAGCQPLTESTPASTLDAISAGVP